jgi:hypothetical protein
MKEDFGSNGYFTTKSLLLSVCYKNVAKVAAVFEQMFK